MVNYKRKKPKKQNKIYRGGIDGPNCSWCASNWYYHKYFKVNGTAIKWECKLDGTSTNWRNW